MEVADELPKKRKSQSLVSGSAVDSSHSYSTSLKKGKNSVTRRESRRAAQRATGDGRSTLYNNDLGTYFVKGLNHSTNLLVDSAQRLSGHKARTISPG